MQQNTLMSYRKAASVAFGKKFSKCASFGWIDVIREFDIPGFNDLKTIQAYDVSRGKYASWEATVEGRVGVLIRQTPYKAELFILYNSDRSLKSFVKKCVTKKVFTARRRVTLRNPPL